MPKYDYRCDSCGHIEEFEFSVHDALPPEIMHLECPGNYRRIYNAAATHFKGQGWGKVYREHTPKKID